MADAVAPQSMADEIRSYLAAHFVEPARRRGQAEFSVTARDVHKALHLFNRFPTVCQVLRSNKFLAQNQIEIVNEEGPPKEAGASLTITYRFSSPSGASKPRRSSLWDLDGLAPDLWSAWSGGEAVLKKERAEFKERLED